MRPHLTPTQVVEALIGPPETVGTICEINSKAPYQWRNGSGSRDPGDLPSTRSMRRLLAHSSARGLGLTEKHLIWGADAAEIAAILAARPGNPACAAE